VAQLPVPVAGALQVRVETRLFPPFTVGLLQAGQAVAAGPALVTKLLRPKLTITSGPVTLATIAPAGDPGRTWPLALAVMGAVAAFVLVRLVR
jgi:hypothetical protein